MSITSISRKLYVFGRVFVAVMTIAASFVVASAAYAPEPVFAWHELGHEGDDVDCIANPELCGGDGVDCQANPDHVDCQESFCEQNPDHQDCNSNPDEPTDPCDIDISSQECYCSTFPEDCVEDPCEVDPNAEGCTDPCDTDPDGIACHCSIWPEDAICWDPCYSSDPPESCNTQYFCEGSGFCEDGTTSACNADPSHVGQEGWEADDSLCNCDCYEDDDTNYYCPTEGACNYDPGKEGLENWEPDDSTCSYEYYCPDPNDPFYTDPSTLTCPKEDSSYCQGIAVCNNASFCEGKPACNYEPDKANTEGFYADDSVCECDGYCPDTEDANYQDPTNMACPRADYDMCEGPGPGCHDSDATNYDPFSYPSDPDSCIYLNSNICQYQANFTVSKINPETGNTRQYDVGVIMIEAINEYSNQKGDAVCPEIDQEEFESQSYSFIYDMLYPSWPDYDWGSTHYSNLGESESEDMCANIPGAQATVPASYAKYGDDCITIDACVDMGCTYDSETEECDCNDMCPNIAGIQSEVPVGYAVDENGDCVTDNECVDEGGVIIEDECYMPVDGVCAVYNPDPSGGKPQGTLCEAGTPTEPMREVYEGEESLQWTWICQGEYTGNDSGTCHVTSLCTGNQQYCSTNEQGNQCIGNNECCTGFMMCNNGCVPYSPSGCGGGPDNCDTSVEPPLCTSNVGTISTDLRVSPPVADVDTNLCALSWNANASGGKEVTCELLQNDEVIATYGPITETTSYNRDVNPGEYQLSCVSTIEESGVDEEGNPTTFINEETDVKDMKCAKNPNYIEF